MDPLSEHNIPWDLITASFQQDLTAEEAAGLQLWLAESTANRDTYGRLEELWSKRLADFPAYQAVDETAAWESLQQQMTHGEGRVVIMRSRKYAFFRSWAAAAVYLLVAAGIVWYLLPGKHEVIYATAGEQKAINLSDGTSIALQPFTEVRVSNTYNQHSRTVNLVKGEALFKVVHDVQKPFMVNMDATSVKDIGTSFNIRRSTDTVKLVVISGKVAFFGKENSEPRELSAGMSLAYDMVKKNFTEWAPADQAMTNRENLLYFDHTLLTDVAKQIEKVYGKKIELASTSIGERKLKADLRGLSFDKALQVICTSLSLDYTDKNGMIVLKDKENK